MKDFSVAPTTVLYVCCGSKCKRDGGKQIYKSLKRELKNLHLSGNVQVIKTGCTDRCKMGPVMAVMPQNDWHLELTEARGKDILHSCIDQFH